MKWFQREIKLAAREAGFHLVTEEIVSAMPEIGKIQIGFLQAFLQHTSASLFINENADPNVRVDFESHFRRSVPEKATYAHTEEGSDDMPAHLKSGTLGTSVMIPIRHGRLALGTWQGIYLGEHRTHAGRRQIIVTLVGEK
jgi:secondary thiamine-phosphate synthase enzyme